MARLRKSWGDYIVFIFKILVFPLKLTISTIVHVLWKSARMKCSLLTETLNPRYVFPIACRDLFYSSSQPVSFITSLSVMTFRCSTVSVKVFWSAIRLPRESCCHEIWICTLVKRGFKMYASEKRILMGPRRDCLYTFPFGWSPKIGHQMR